MHLVEQAYKELYPDKTFTYTPELKYSGHLKGYNGNITLRNTALTIKLGKQWRHISNDIKIGIIQELMTRLFKTKKTTPNTQLYNIFLKKVHYAIPKTKTHPVLETSFNNINEQHFASTLEQPNLTWCDSINKLGHYEYGTDTIAISKILEDKPELLNYVMHHEMLHKKLKYDCAGGRHNHHTLEFRKREQAYPNAAQLEKELQHFVTMNVRRRRAQTSMFSRFFR